MRTVQIRPLAEHDLDEQFSYIAQSGIEVGQRFLSNVRRFPNHLLFFRADDATIEVIRILHAARDLERVLADGK